MKTLNFAYAAMWVSVSAASMAAISMTGDVRALLIFLAPTLVEIYSLSPNPREKN